MSEDRVRGSWFSATTYDLFLSVGERAGMSDYRASLVGQARGEVLEIGAGTGLNLAHYPAHLKRLVLCEPEPHMAKRLERKVARLRGSAQIVQARAERLPFDDDSFDTVVSTLVLCTVADPEAALDEIRRVLRPAGAFLFLEHVRSDDDRLARWQDRLNGPWRSFAEGCNCNRRTVERLRARGYSVNVADRRTWRRMPPLVRPLVAGSARPAA